VNFAYECNDPAACAGGNLLTINGTAVSSNSNNPLLGYSYTGINLTFDVNGNSTSALNLNYEDVGQVTLRVQKTITGVNLVGKTNAFVVKPDHFAVDVCKFATAGDCVLGTVATPTDGTGSILAISGTNAATQAGTAFKATVRSMSANNNVTPSFGTAGSVSGSNATEDVTLTHTCVAPFISPAVTCAGGATASSLAGTKLFKRNTFANGVKTVSDLTWDDVGVITLTANKTAGQFMGVASAATGVSANAGRFRPDHFNTAVTQVTGVPMACPDGSCPATFNGIVYSGQPFSVTVTAKNANDAPTANYSAPSGFAKTTTLTPYGALGTATAPSGAGDLGVASVTAFAAGTLTESTEKYTFTTTPTSPTNIYINASDGEANSRRTTNPTTTSIEGGVRVVSGRINIPNMYGSERLPLPLTATVQYYNSGTNWVTSLTDSVTSFNTNLSTASGNLVATVKTGLASGITVVTPGAATVAAGVRTFILAAPLVSGSVELSLNAPTYLPNAASRATFGIFKSPLIYRRENY
jgi:MSHA biogenesis protein MshQ